MTLYGAWAAPPSTTGFIRVDQFGYLQNARKVAVIVDPQVGSNANTHFTPSTWANGYQVRRWSDDAVVFSGTIQAWKEGVTQQTSGDKGWWFDFSTVNTPGSYYLFDVGNNVGSYRFEIGDNVYNDVLKTALRTFYYQRINFAKQTPFADPRWADGATHEGPLQDRQATSRYAKGDLSTAKDLHGGWMDAGDMNKYVTFAEEPVGLLLESYRLNPSAFGDNLNIPESGNGLPDVLDEVKWELDWLRRMQDATGTGGLFLKVGVDNYNESNPPSTDRRPRYYLPECTASTLSGAAMFATAGAVYRTIPALQAYAADMTARAERAFARARTTTNGFTSFQTDCDDGDIRAGDADKPANIQKQSAMIAAIYLFEATGKAEYKAYVENTYAQTDLMANGWWGPYGNHAHIALLRYAANASATPAVAAAIRAMKSQQNSTLSVNDYTAKTDLYRAYMPDAQYHWGSSQVRANAGAANLDFVAFNVNGSNKALYRDVAASYLHWFHGVNAQGKVMLSNMYAYGADDSQNEIYHVWFADGTPYDNALTSPKGPVPGYLTCGPQNLLYYTGTHTYLKSEPLQKRYKDWNGGFPENSWELTEVAIYNQAAYINLLSRLMVPTSDPTDTEPPTTPTNLVASDLSPYSVKLTWNGSVDNRAVTAYEIHQNGAKIAETPETSISIETLSPATSYTFTVRAIDFSANRSGASNAVAVTTPAPSPNDLIIYGDAYRSLIQKWSWNATDNSDNTSPVKMGQKSIKVDVSAAWGALSLRNNDIIRTADYPGGVQFWFYGTDKAVRVTVNTIDTAPPSDPYRIPAEPGVWTLVRIPWSELGNPAQIQRISFGDGSGGPQSFYLDDIRLVAGAATPPTTPPTTPPPASTASAGEVIYEEALNTNWQEWGWSVSTNYGNTNPVKVNQKSLAINYTDGWGGWAITRNTHFIPTPQTTLRFWIFATTNKTIGVCTNSENDSGQSPFVSFRPTPNVWQEVVITMAQLGNPAKIKRLTLQSQEAGTNLIYVDNVRLEGSFGVTAGNVTSTSLHLTWSAPTGFTNVAGYEVLQNGNVLIANAVNTSLNVSGLACGTGYTFTIRAKDAAGNALITSVPVSVSTTLCPGSSPAEMIYDEAFNSAGWDDWSWGVVRNYGSTSPVKFGQKAAALTLDGWGGWSIFRKTHLPTTPQMTLKFWLNATTNKTLAVTVYAENDSQAGTTVNLTPTPNVWQEVTLTMAQLGNPARIKRIVVNMPTFGPNLVHLDNVRIEMPTGAARMALAPEIPAEDRLTVSPNPANGPVRVEVLTDVAQEATLSVLSLSGALVHSKPVTAQPGLNSYTLSLSRLPAGTYLVTWQTATQRLAKRVVMLPF